MRVAAVLCTYNESAALPEVLARLEAAVADLLVVVVDDDSPDGTARVAESHGARVILRQGVPRGRGLSGREGYRRALELGVDAILEMDADGSHDPADAPKLLEALSRADIAVGSRAAASGGGARRGAIRRAVSAAAKFFLRRTLGLPLADPTSGYRAFRRESLWAIDPGSLRSVGPEIVEEVYWKARQKGLRMVEVPIVFHKRAAGASKLTLIKLVRVLWRCWKLRLQ